MKIDHSELPPLNNQFIDIPQVLFVGGWARDFFRKGVEPTDVDIMVAGVSEKELLDRGFRKIDSSNNETFGVFQDNLGREVAMARTEVSTGDGHREFNVEPIFPDVDPREAIEIDLKRRDFTVNAIAFDRDGFLWDLHNGVEDLREGVIRAVDDSAFVQDPLRIVRGARFAAILNANITPSTKNLMREMVDSLKDLPAERTRMELEKVLVQSDKPSRFFHILKDVGALKIAFPELHQLRFVPSGPKDFHKEGDAFCHTMMVLEEMATIMPKDEIALLMAIAHDLGKARTSVDDLPHHPNHGDRGSDIVGDMANRLNLSNEQSHSMKEASRFHMRMHNIKELRESTVINTVLYVRNLERLKKLALADSRGRIPSKDCNIELINSRFEAAQKAINEWKGVRLIEEGYHPDEIGGKEFGDLLHQKRVEMMREIER